MTIKMYTKKDALESLLPLAEYLVDINNNITWLSTDITEPTEEEYQAEIDSLQLKYDNKQYARDRAIEYPSIIKQLELLGDDAVYGTTTYKDAIKAIKDKYPKE